MQSRHFLIGGVMLGALLACSPARSQDETFTELKSGKKFPAKITFSHEGREITLIPTGALQVRKEAKKSADAAAGETALYTLAHYMEEAKPEGLQSLYDMILEKPVAKQMILDFDREATADHLKRVYARFFAKALTPEEHQQMKGAIDEFIATLNADIMPKQQIVFRWLPDNSLVIVLPNAPEKVLGASPLASWLWKAWFSEASPIDRSSLVEKLTAK